MAKALHVAITEIYPTTAPKLLLQAFPPGNLPPPLTRDNKLEQKMAENC